MQVIMAGVCWGTLGIFSTRLGDMGFGSFQITILRVLTAGILLLVLVPRVWPVMKTMQRAEWINLALQSLIGVLGMTLCYFFAVAHVGVYTHTHNRKCRPREADLDIHPASGE